MLKVLLEYPNEGGDAVVLSFLADAISQFFETGHLTDNLKTGIVKHLLKNSNVSALELQQLTKYRPTTLQSVIVKLASAIFVHRVRTKSNDGNRHPQQRGWKSRMGVHEAVRVLLNVVSVSEMKDSPLIILFADGQKAFDSAKSDILDKVLEKMGMHASDRKLVESLMNGLSRIGPRPFREVVLLLIALLYNVWDRITWVS
jgi:hypothetical protein